MKEGRQNRSSRKDLLIWEWRECRRAATPTCMKTYVHTSKSRFRNTNALLDIMPSTRGHLQVAESKGTHVIMVRVSCMPAELQLSRQCVQSTMLGLSKGRNCEIYTGKARYIGLSETGVFRSSFLLHNSRSHRNNDRGGNTTMPTHCAMEPHAALLACRPCDSPDSTVERA